jgi:hypothetical protein
MLIEETVTYLEMTAAEQLRPGRLPPAPVQMVELDQAAASVLRRTYARIAVPLNWQSRRTWSDAQWAQRLARSPVHAWIARVGEEVAGMVELEAQGGGDVEIVVFGLVPEFVGRGFGAHLLTVGTGLAWELEPLDSARVCDGCGCTPPRAITPTPSPTMNVAGSVHFGPSDASVTSRPDTPPRSRPRHRAAHPHPGCARVTCRTSGRPLRAGR